jgi:hypothetical protein
VAQAALLATPATWAARPVSQSETTVVLSGFDAAVVAEANAAVSRDLALAKASAPASVGAVERSYTGPIVLGAVGLALLLGGVITGAVKSDLDNVASGRYSLQTAAGREDVVFAASVTADLLFIVGGGLTAGGLIWGLLEGTSTPTAAK